MRAVVAALRRMPEVGRVCSTNGRWDLVAEITHRRPRGARPGADGDPGAEAGRQLGDEHPARGAEVGRLSSGSHVRAANRSCASSTTCCCGSTISAAPSPSIATSSASRCSGATPMRAGFALAGHRRRAGGAPAHRTRRPTSWSADADAAFAAFLAAGGTAVEAPFDIAHRPLRPGRATRSATRWCCSIQSQGGELVDRRLQAEQESSGGVSAGR